MNKSLFVTLSWYDGSKKIVETLPREVLKEKYNIDLEEDEVYDILYKRKIWIPEGVQVAYSEDYPQIEGVDVHANRFI